jgi:hypothetical protein
MIFGAHLDNDDFSTQIEEEPNKYKCRICGYITNKPRINNNYAKKQRCEDFCCDGPVDEYIKP